jgi:hypothetical protein
MKDEDNTRLDFIEQKKLQVNFWVYDDQSEGWEVCNAVSGDIFVEHAGSIRDAIDEAMEIMG